MAAPTDSSNLGENPRCVACGKAVPRNAPGGMCPACLLGQGVELVAATQARPGGFHPPSVQDLALLFPEYTILEMIGLGGMGAVYKALQSELDRTVAIKILPPETAANREFTERFRREAATLAHLDDPNIVKLFDYGQREGFAYFVMEFVDGTDLARRLKQGPVPLAETMAMVGQLCDALQHSHGRGVVHRDIKPANILLTRDGRVKVADFGLARLVHSETSDPGLTRTHAALGTPRYMAPEQMAGSDRIDHRADVYAVGVVLYELLTGAIPAGHFDPPSRKVTTLNPRLDLVTLRALSAEPEQRYGRISELKADLEEAVLRPAPSPREHARALAVRALLVSTATAFLGVAGVLAWTFWMRPKGSDIQEGGAVLTRLAGDQAGWLAAWNESGTVAVPGVDQLAVAAVVASAQAEYGLVLGLDGNVRGWGDNRFGQTEVPAGLSGVIDVAVGQGDRCAHALALRDDGTVMGWGDNTFHQARPPAGLTNVIAVAAGELHSVALTRSGRVVAWGNPASAAVVVPENLPSAKAIAAGADFTLVLLKDGHLIAWGDNEWGQCRPPEISEPITAIAAGAGHGLARLTNGRVVAWGNGQSGQCDVPPDLPPIIAVFAGGEGSGALDAEGILHAWGNVPPAVHALTKPVRRVAIGARTCVVLLKSNPNLGSGE